MLTSVLIFATVAVDLGLGIAVAGTTGRHDDTTLFFENDGNWTSHGTKPSALFINSPSSHADAAAACEAQNEKLLSCDEYADYANLFSYQQYLGAISSNQLFWSSCSSSSPTSWRGVVNSEKKTSSSPLLPFLCTNSAPIVDKVDTDYSVYPRVQTISNGTTFEGIRDHMAFRFIGIPFVQPPTGELRFQPAQPWNNSVSRVNATEYGPACLQFGYFEGNSYGLSKTS